MNIEDLKKEEKEIKHKIKSAFFKEALNKIEELNEQFGNNEIEIQILSTHARLQLDKNIETTGTKDSNTERNQIIESILNLLAIVVVEAKSEIKGKIDQKGENHSECPKLKITLNEKFKILDTDEEIEISLNELKFNMENNISPTIEIELIEEEYFVKKLQILSKNNIDITTRKEILEVKRITNILTTLKEEISEKLKILVSVNMYPITENFNNLLVSCRETIESITFPNKLIEETNFNEYFKLSPTNQAIKYNGKTKLEIFKNIGKNQLGCAIFLDMDELEEINKGLSGMQKILDDSKNINMYFYFSPDKFPDKIILEKLIPSFVDKIYDFKGNFYGFLKKDDYKSWNELWSYDVGLG